MTIRAQVRGVGHYLPERVVPNAWFEDRIDTSDEWIRSRSGIERRHFAAEGETTSDMAAKAAEAALAKAGLKADDIDALIVATSTADLTFPSAATMVQDKLGMTKGFAFDVQAVCAGFVFALANGATLTANAPTYAVAPPVWETEVHGARAMVRVRTRGFAETARGSFSRSPTPTR